MRHQPQHSGQTRESRRAVAILFCLVASAPGFASDSGFAASVTLTSEYIYRGQARSDGNPAVQLGLDYEHGSGWFAGVWSSTIDMQSPYGRRDVELDYYAGYHHAFEAPLTLAASLIRYTYPGQTGSFDYDHNQWLVTATFDDRFSLEAGYSDDIYGWGRIGRHWEARLEQPFSNAWVLGAGLGRNDLDDIGVEDYLYWDVGASSRFSRVTVDLRWYDNEPIRGILDWLSAGSQVVLSLTAAF